MRRKAGVLFIVIGVFVASAAGGGLALRHEMHGEGFCHSCHLPDGTPMHDRKMRLMEAEPPRSLAGVHFHLGKGQRLACPECHHGTTRRETVGIMIDAALNTARYFLGEYEEPRKLKVPIPDGFCTGCHADLATAAPFGSFHASWSHGELKVLDRQLACTDCHLMHQERPDTGDSFLERDRTLERCDLCHGRSMNRESVVIGLERDLGLRP